MAARTWEKGRRETSWFEAGLPRVAARSHSRLPGPWNTWGIQPSRCSVWDEPLVTLQQLNIFFTVVRTRMTPCALSLHPVSATHPVQGTPPPRTRRGGVRGGGNASIGTKVGIGGAATHPPPWREQSLRENLRTPDRCITQGPACPQPCSRSCKRLPPSVFKQ